MAPKFLPLRWESTGDEWWFASPIDCAAANGHSDVVLALLRLDPNLLIKLTSLPRIRRLETLWNDDGDFGNFNNVAKCRSDVARKLLREYETGKGHNSLIRAGYGGWLLYTAACAGDLGFVKELLERDRLMVFGEGEYGITDILYAAARGRSGEVFRLLLDCAVGEVGGVLRWEVINRAVHAAARGGSAAAMEELLGDGGEDVLRFRDAEGSTVLHTAAGRGQVPIVKKLISSYDDIISSVDDRGNTALNVAAYRGHLAVMEVLISASPSSALLTNNYGDTFLHMAIAGFRTPSFRWLDRQIELITEVLGGKVVKIEEVVNVRNNDGRTALHLAVVESIQSEVVEMLLSVRCIDVNICDGEGNTPLDLLRQRPRTASSEILIKKVVAAGGVSGCEDRSVRNCHLRIHGIGGSPGTSFRIPDAEMVLYVGLEDTCPSSCEFVTTECGYSGEAEAKASASPIVARTRTGSLKLKKLSSMTSATNHLKTILRWPRRSYSIDVAAPELIESFSGGFSKSNSIPLRQQFSRQVFPPNNKRILSLQGNLPSPNSKRKFVIGLTNARQVLPKSNLGSPCSALSESSWSSPASVDQKKLVSLECISAGPSSSTESPNVEKIKMKRRHGSFNLRLMNNYFCFGAQGLAIENSIHEQGQSHRNRHSLVDVV